MAHARSRSCADRILYRDIDTALRRLGALGLRRRRDDLISQLARYLDDSGRRGRFLDPGIDAEHMAARAATSSRFFDPRRAICLACDRAEVISAEYRAHFDHVVALQECAVRRGTEHHFYLDQLSPFERTLYVDADCLMANRRIHEILGKLEQFHVGFPGRKLTDGVWRVDVAKLRAQLNID